MGRRDNGEGSVRKLSDGYWECVTQSKYINPQTCKPKRFKRKGKTEKEAKASAKAARDAWEKEIEKKVISDKNEREMRNLELETKKDEKNKII